MSAHETHPKRPSPKCVTIFGGGIAGLTAAHELIERNFRVQVWEPNVDSRAPDGGPDVGGMARTQWGRVSWPETRQLGKIEEGKARVDDPKWWEERQATPIVALPLVIYSRDDASGTTVRPTFAFGPCGVTDPDDAVKKTLEILVKNPSIRTVYCEIQRRLRGGESLDGEQVKRGVEYFGELLKRVSGNGWRATIQPSASSKSSSLQPPLTEQSSPESPQYAQTDYRPWQLSVTVNIHAPTGANARPITVYVLPLDGFPDDAPAEYTHRMSFRVRERWLPGEHGFRFFPSFYSHVFDTMKRTPILEPVEKSVVGAAQERSVTVNAEPQKLTETGRTAFDSLRSLSETAFGVRAGKLPMVESRFRATTLEQVRKWMRLFFGKTPEANDWNGQQGKAAMDERVNDQSPYGLGTTFRDAARFEMKVLQYLTSCEERREQYQQMTWLDFLGGEDAYSQTFIKMVEAWPEALVAMDAKTIDARTHGSALMQFLLDNLRAPGYRDGTLVGPTSEAWLRPWRTYLEAQGVEFINGKLTGFQAVQLTDKSGNTRPIVWPTVECYEPRYPLSGGTEKLRQPGLLPGYFLLALPVEDGKTMAQKYLGARPPGSSPLIGSDLRMLADMDLPRVDVPRPDGPLRHMIGIQYYFDEDIAWLDGHVVFLNSKWRVSGISQDHFWRDRPDWEHGYRGILSTIFSVTTNDAPNDSWNMRPEKIAAAVWAQASRDLPGIPPPAYWHIDEGFEWTGNGYKNKTPYLINPPGDWDRRPGNLPRARDRTISSGYEVVDGIVLAGTHMKTYTRVTSMEAANESARHAVNGILRDVEQTTGEEQSFCSIWPLEEREVDDFQILKDLDKELYDRGLDHFVEILELDELAANVLRGGGRDPLDMLSALRGIGGLLRVEFPFPHGRSA